MKRDLALIDAMGCIHETLDVIVKCITLEDIDHGEMHLLAYMAQDYLKKMHDVLDNA